MPANLLDDTGRLWIDVVNPNDIALTFPVGEGLELLYPESTFGVNFIRGLAIIFCWLALLASIGMAAASFLSFPVAAFVSLALLIIAFSSGTVSSVVEQGTITGYDAAKGGYGHTPVDLIVVPIFRGALKIIKLVQSFSPIDNSEFRAEHHLGAIGAGGGANRRVVGRFLLPRWASFFSPAANWPPRRAIHERFKRLKIGH